MSKVQDNNKNKAIIIGGSLSGLMTAIALASKKIQVTVFEKSQEGSRTGAGLQVDGDSYNQSNIEEKLKDIVSNGKSEVKLWTTIESNLRKAAHKNPYIKLNFNTRIVSIGQNSDSVWAKTKENKVFNADVLIGADGHRSMVRKHVSPNHPDAEFAGYVVWMASVLESEIPKDKRPKSKIKDVQMFNSPGGFMFGSVIKDKDHLKRIGCTWYDNTKFKLLERLGAVDNRVVHHSLDGSDIPDKEIDKLIEEAKIKWPQPWQTATIHALKSKDFIGIPIKEYVPEKLVNNRFALVGDAAHVPAPITASGFNESLKDAATLGELASRGFTDNNAIAILNEYELNRLNKVQNMVKSGQYFTQSFGRFR